MFFAGLILSSSAKDGHEHDPADSHVIQGHASTGVSFIANKGQWLSKVLYRAEVNGLALFAELDGITFSKLQEDAGDLLHEVHLNRTSDQPTVHGHAWRMKFVGANINPRLEAGRRKQHHLNYFLGNDPSKWAGEVPCFYDIAYTDLWPEVNMHWYSEDGMYKYDILLDAGADHHQIDLAYEGLDGIHLRNDGALVLGTSVGEVIEMKPVAWYADGAKEKLDCNFVVNGNSVGFSFGAEVDHSRPIVIDPLLLASTLSGTGDIGTSENYGHASTFDEQGHIYTGARSFGQGYPTNVGSFQLNFGGGFTDIVISKLSADGSALMYATYLGGNDDDLPHSMVVNANEELFVLGSSSSFDYPVSMGAYDTSLNGPGFGITDIVITHLNSNGSAIIGSTYLGGADMDGFNQIAYNYGDNFRGEIVLEAAGNCVVAASTSSTDFPVTPGALQAANAGQQDAVLVSLDPALSILLFSTYIGGAGMDAGYGLTPDGTGGYFVCGAAEGQGFPITPGVFAPAYSGGANDAFVAHISGNGSVMAQSTFFGTTSLDQAFFVDTDQDGFVYIYGESAGTIPITPAGTYGTPGDVFVAKLEPDLSATLITTEMGDGTDLAPIAFLVDVCGHIYISMHAGPYAMGFGMPITANALQATGGFYLAAFDADLTSLLFGSYYGGDGDHVDGGTSRFDKDGIVYQGVCTDFGFNTTANAFSSTYPFGYDIGVFKIDFQVAAVNAAGGSNINEGCAPVEIEFSNTSTGDQWIWDFGDGSPTVSIFEPTYTYTTQGSYTVMLIAYDSLTCTVADTITFPITINTAQVLTAGFTISQTVDCSVFQVQTTNTTTGSGVSFQWNMGDGTTYTDTNVVHNYATAGTYDVQLIAYDPVGCAQPDTVVSTIVIAEPILLEAAFTIEQLPDCDDLLVSTTNTSIGNAPVYTWIMGDGTQLTGTDITHVFSGAGTYTVELIAVDSTTCNIADTVSVQVIIDPLIQIVADFTIDQVLDCEELVVTTTNLSSGSNMAFEWNMSDGTQYNDTNVVHTFSGPGTYDITLVITDLWGCVPDVTSNIQVIIDPLVPVTAAFTVQQTDSCTLLLVSTTNSSIGNVSYNWDMGDGTIYDTFEPTHAYDEPGTYTVTLSIADLDCGQSDEYSLPVTLINDLPTSLVPQAVICLGETTVLDATADVDTYSWNTGETTPTITVAEGGIYFVEVVAGTCTGRDTVEVLQAVEFDLSDSLIACPRAEVLLSIPIEGTAYQWVMGGTNRTQLVYGEGAYPFTVWDELNCPHLDTITVLPKDPDAFLFAPNAFTPDDDGRNDTFIITGYGEGITELLIFNRWGEKIYETGSPIRPWDGTFKGTPVKNDVYVYRLEYNAECTPTEQVTKLGHVMVVR